GSNPIGNSPVDPDYANRAECLKEENASLRAEVSHIRSKCEQLLAENASLKARNALQEKGEHVTDFFPATFVAGEYALNDKN
ncbi:hypothetical protein Tco_0778417, partial [Tanacetum coccineum]